MVINKINLVIPNDIQKGIESGIYKQFGSIIRNNKGQIIKTSQSCGSFKR